MTLNHGEEQARAQKYAAILRFVDEIYDDMSDEEHEALRTVDQEIYDEDGLPQ